MSTPQPETKAEAESLVPRFKLERVLNQDQNGRRISLLGSIADMPALITLERAAFPTEPELVSLLLKSLINTTNLGANDIYRWYLANRSTESSSSATGVLSASSATSSLSIIPDFKLNLIYPCSAQHIRKYSAQRVRMVTETPHIYSTHIKPYITGQRAAGRLDWVFNILEGRTEQEDVIARVDWDSPSNTGFLLLPDLNWDRKTVEGMHLLALVQRRDIWSLRDLKKKHIPWLKAMREQIVAAATAKVFPPGQVEADEVKCYLHYQPTYYHLHVHVVHAMLEAGTTQSVGKAFGLGNVIAQLEGMQGDEEAGMHEVDLHYFLGEENDLWKKCFGQLKKGGAVDLNL
ncbi:uncharacterized protein A1O5_01984 [Cladophialophora psammophila CBS 110553]|uniref:Scavenger mRNA-decapping enzyme DcpS n=1 Tax=Cladophialophora psammophila CBS 110553 TaxID=1182543 RepID=W9X503_9EURO|nr:uncharacterized protein A1O5_01984 [Cladophialophora psammophila CBS 110553]EXJ75288.1 hypothetical protein A1O5_01984 [Cladophialophora psammophila CBS 110553]